MGSTRIRAAALILGVAAVIVIAAVLLFRPRETVLVPYVRFVDETQRTKATEQGQPVRALDLPTATLAHDTRYVLRAMAHDAIAYTEKATVGPDGTATFRPVLPPALRDAERLVLRPQIRVDTQWTVLPNFETPVVEEDGARKTRIALPIPDVAPGTSIGVHIEAFAVERHEGTTHRTGPVRIPEGAVLEFALGIAEPAWPQGPVLFEVRACRDETCEPVFEETVDPGTNGGRGWRQHRVSLASLAGTDRVFEFAARVMNADPHAFSFPLWANPTIYRPVPQTDDAINIILLSIDTLSAGHLTTYGSANDTAPFIAATFGTSGVVFENCVAAATTTPPSHMTMLTSVQPCAHGLRLGYEMIPGWLTTLAEVMRAGDFETGAVTEDGWIDTGHGFGRGFDSFAENVSPDIMEPIGQVDVTFDKAKQWLAQNKDKRFFLFLHTFQVHAPYEPPPAYQGLFTMQDGRPVDDKSPRPVRDRVNYDREIRYTDDQLRALFAEITALHLDRNTIFILTSDHGEEFFEHGQWGHGSNLYQEVTHVPLMVWGPGRVVAGRRVTDAVGHVDIMPTVLDLAGLVQPPQVSGLSLALVLKERQARASGTIRPLFTEAWTEFAFGPDYELIATERPGYMAQVGSEKLIRYRRNGAFVYERYDLAADPLERNNAYDPGARDAVAMQSAVDTYESACRTAAETIAREQQDRPGVSGTRPFPPEQEEKLRALGYIQ